MTDVKWIKIVTDIFDDEKIKMIEVMPDGDTIIVIWFKLLCLAGKQNNSGVIMLNERIAYTDEMLATVFRRPVNTVRLALKTFEKFGMIEIIEDVITIPNWNKYQTLDSLESRREKDKIRQAHHRAAQKALAERKFSDNCMTDADTSRDSHVTERDTSRYVTPLEVEEDIDIEKDNISSLSKEDICAEPASERTVISIILNNKTYYDITQSQVDRWKELYPAVDVMQELRKMCGWSESNPTKRKTRGGILRFITNWLAREQDRGKAPSASKASTSDPFAAALRGDVQ